MQRKLKVKANRDYAKTYILSTVEPYGETGTKIKLDFYIKCTSNKKYKNSLKRYLSINI